MQRDQSCVEYRVIELVLYLLQMQRQLALLFAAGRPHLLLVEENLRISEVHV